MTIDYPDPIEWQDYFNRWVQLKAEQEAIGLDEKVDEIRRLLDAKLAEVIALPEDVTLADIDTFGSDVTISIGGNEITATTPPGPEANAILTAAAGH